MKTSGVFSPWQNELADKREFKVISREKGYWQRFWLWRRGQRPAQNVVNIKGAAHG